eukprot:TRINITY_DN64013_c0_g1_i1.p1 TRINITY_DN64013_c0_g1~~TRINITY_DN64013_c0_g1_i1.p1  ORF type:complete len:546 (+),score=97.90 TRINITY_DN64013_c0_g1_i1:44-1639(+)
MVKVGIGIAQDVALLHQNEGIVVQGYCDLFLLASRDGHVPSSRPCGLAHLTSLLLSEELIKEDAVRKCDWGQRPLSVEQLEYAARDALAGRDCGEVLYSRSIQPCGAVGICGGCPDPAEHAVEVADAAEAVITELEQEGVAAGQAATVAVCVGNSCGRTSKGLVLWCGDLMNRAPKLRGVKGAGKPEASPVSKALSCTAYSCVTKFGARRIVDSEGRTMLHMKERTVQGLLRRGLATVVDDGDATMVRLNFSPNDNYEYAGLDAVERNACVGCNSSGVARYYVVPRVFFTHLPSHCKSYNCHDVVMLCPSCRATAEKPQLERVKELLAQHGGVAAGSGCANSCVLGPREEAARRAAKALLRPPSGSGRKGKIPAAKEMAFREAVADVFGIDADQVDRERLEEAVRLGDLEAAPSARVCAAFCADEDGLRAFLREWRELFVATLKPCFLAEGWAVDTGLDGRFVPSVAAAVEWPGDWRCQECGVHCFNRSSRCRCCGAARPSTDAAGLVQSLSTGDKAVDRVLTDCGGLSIA